MKLSSASSALFLCSPLISNSNAAYFDYSQLQIFDPNICIKYLPQAPLLLVNAAGVAEGQFSQHLQLSKNVLDIPFRVSWIFWVLSVFPLVIRAATKMAFWVFLTMHYLESPICISYLHKPKTTKALRHITLPKTTYVWGKQRKNISPSIFWENSRKRTFGKHRLFFTDYNWSVETNNLKNEIVVYEEMSFEGLRKQLWSGIPVNYVLRSGEQVISQCRWG